jgi:hypothetical protein
MGKITKSEARDQAQRVEHAFTKKLLDLDAEGEKRKQACSARASRDVAGVEKTYQQGLNGAKAARQAQEAKAGAAHKKRIAQAKRARQSDLKKIGNDFDEAREAVRVVKKAAMAPIEEALQHQLDDVDEWVVGEKAVAEQERLEALSSIEDVEEEESE